VLAERLDGAGRAQFDMQYLPGRSIADAVVQAGAFDPATVLKSVERMMWLFAPYSGAALPALRESRGRVVNVASGMAFVALPFAPAYAMSKHGVVAYSGALRLEHGDAITVTTVYPGYIRTPIHRDSIEFGLTLEGSSPPERIEDAVRALTRGALADPAPRDIVTTRTGMFTVALSRFAPRRFVDHVILRTLRKNARGRSFDGAAPPVVDFARRLTSDAHQRRRSS